MRNKWKLLLATMLVVGLGLALFMGLNVDAQGQGGEIAGEIPPVGDPPAVREATAAVTSSFSYQGSLSEGGELVSGTRQMTFSLYADAACSMAVGDPLVYSVSVNDGLFAVDLAFDQADFNGQARWLQTEVEGTMIGCQPVQPVPYANSLRPGAIISGAVSAESNLLHIRSGTETSTEGVVGAMLGRRTSLGYPVGVHGYGYEYGSTGVWGTTDSQYSWSVNGVAEGPNSIGVRGIANDLTTASDGVYGETASATGAGGRFVNTATSDPGWALVAEGRHGTVITSTGGTALYAYGSGDSAIGDDGVSGIHTGDGVVGESTSTGNLDNGVVGFSAGGYGIYGFSNGTGQYGGYFDDPIAVNGGCTGCSVRYVTRNTSDMELRIGDLVRVTGVETGLQGMHEPVMQVAPATSTDRVLGVVVGRTEMTMVEPGTDDVQPGAHYGPVGGTAGPGDYVVIVVQGMAQVRLDPAAETRIGDRIGLSDSGVTAAVETASFGTLLDEADRDGLAWVLIGFE